MKSKSVRARKFVGELNQPIKLRKHMGLPPRVPNILFSSENAQSEYAQQIEEYESRCRQYVADEQQRKLGLLMKHYLIEDPTDYKSLAIKLALDLVRGFDISIETSGAKEIWNPYSLAKLYADVERIRASSKVKTNQFACKKLKDDPMWKEFTGGATWKVFVNKYGEAKKSPIIQLLEKVCNYDPSQAQKSLEMINRMFSDYFQIKLSPEN